MQTAIRLGEGSHTYELIDEWAKTPPGVQLGYTHGVVTDAEDNVYVFNQSKDAVAVFGPDGGFLRSWGEEFAEGAHGMLLNYEDGTPYLYLVDYAIPAVVKATLDGRELLRIGIPDIPDVYDSPEKYKPTGVAVAPNGDFYVCDGYGQSWIHQYDGEGRHVRSWGGMGSEPGKMQCAHGVWVDTRGEEPVLLVADRANVRIQIFSLDGEHIGFVTDDLRYPCNFFETGGDLVIPDLYGRVTIFDRDNRLIAHLGDNPGVEKHPAYPNLPHNEREPGRFISPHAACVDSRGDLYVVEWVSDGRITKLRRV